MSYRSITNAPVVDPKSFKKKLVALA